MYDKYENKPFLSMYPTLPLVGVGAYIYRGGTHMTMFHLLSTTLWPPVTNVESNDAWLIPQN